MLKRRKSYFKDDIRRIFVYYAIIPVLALTVLCLIIFWGAWRYTLEKTTKENNNQITEVMKACVTSYMEILDEISGNSAYFLEELSTDSRVSIFEGVYEVSNAINKKGDLYLFDDGLEPIVLGTKVLPDFLDGTIYGNWGIFRIMKNNPSEIGIIFEKNPETDRMQLVIGEMVLDQEVPIGYAVFVIDSKQFELEIADKASQTVITNDYDWVFIANNYVYFNKLDRFQVVDIDGSKIVNSEVGKYFITKQMLFDGKIHVYSLASMTNQSVVFTLMIIVLAFVFILLIIAVFASAKAMASKKTKNLYILLDAFEKVKNGILDNHINMTEESEWLVIADSYNLMIDSLKEQIEANKEMGKLVISSQAKQLESQFNPHFLYNSLENIRFMCKLDADAANNMIMNLSALLRYSINNNFDDVTLDEDVHYIQNYMSILKYRFNQRFHYQIEIGENAKTCIVPRLILQPMIENAIKYGFEGRESLHIDITAEVKETSLILTCSDDGCGMDEDTFKTVNDLLTKSTNKSDHFGLYNIHRRIRLKYGFDFGIQIQSQQDFGTKIQVRIPVRYRTNQEE